MGPFIDKEYIRKHLFPAIILSAATLSPAAFSQEVSGQASFQAHRYFSFDLARVNAISRSGVQDFQLTNLNMAWGHQFHPNFSGELWASLNAVGEKDRYVSAEPGQRVDAEYNSFGVFGIAKKSTSPYLSARLGLASSSFSYTSKGYADEEESSMGLAFGVGAGIEKNQLRIELEYMEMPEVDDPLFSSEGYTSSMISLGFNYAY